jgi:hypothetical protein
MQWCLGMLEHWNGSENPLKLMVWCLSMSECWNGSEHPLNLMDMLDIGKMQIIYRI